MIPPLEDGLLPPGVWSCSLDELAATFGHTAHRRLLLDRLVAQINRWDALPHAPILVDGSFVTEKEVPSDIDICVDLDPLKPDERAPWERVFYYERWYLEQQGIDFWFRSPDFPEDVSQTEFPRVKAVQAERLNLPKDIRKGFLRIP